MFFSLSGFLITWLILREIALTGAFSVRNFYVRRVLRIWPVYFIVVGFVFTFYAGLKSLAGLSGGIRESLLMSALFLSNFDLIRVLAEAPANVNGMLSLTWSVSVEEQFYFVWPWLFVLLIAKPKILMMAIYIVMIVAVAFVAEHAGPLHSIYYHTITNFLFLGGGAWVALVLSQNERALSRILKLTKIQWLFTLVALLLVLGSAASLVESSVGTAIYLLLSLLFIVLLIVSQIAPGGHPFQLSKIPGAVWLSTYTYGIYMYHRIVGFVVDFLMFRILDVGDYWYWGVIGAICTVAGTVLTSWLSYRYVEAPLLRLKKHFTIEGALTGTRSGLIHTQKQG